MKKILLILIIILMTNPAFAWQPDRWTVKDTIFQTAFLSTLAIDAWQTYTFLYTGNYRERGFYENNPILGKYPSKQKFFLYWSSCALLHTSVSYILPRPYRTIWQYVWIGIKSNYIYHNYKIGVRINF